MRSVARKCAIAALVAAATTGCASMNRGARYVYQDGEYGVVAIPENTATWPNYYREQAFELMWEHFPEGYEVVRAEEVVEGDRVLDVARTRESEYDPAILAAGAVLKIARLERKTGYEQKDMLKVKECRLVYHRKSPHPPQSLAFGGYAAKPNGTPALYIDPNSLERERNEILLAEAKKAAAEGKTAELLTNKAKKDDAVKVAGGTADPKPATAK